MVGAVHADLCRLDSRGSAAEMIYMVVRTDDNGRSYLVADRLSSEEATECQRRLLARGHKQDYTIHSYANDRDRDETIARMAIQL